MKHVSAMLVGPLSLAVAFVGLDPTVRADAPGVAVVESFTSEGCSSCPPADAAIADLLRDSRGQAVFVLAFHVDYWDSGAWTDPFSAHAFTDRQTAYARMLKLDNIYTPQAIVNGSREFVGSNRATLKAAVAEAENQPAVGSLKTTVSKPLGNSIPIDVAAAGLPAGTIVNVALVESGLSVAVRGGENGGRTLTHEHVVRAFTSIPLGAGNAVHASLTVPPDVRRERTSVVVYAQRPADLHVIAAAEVASAP